MSTKLVTYDDRSPLITYYLPTDGHWYDEPTGQHDGTATSTNATLATAAFVFKGTSVTVYGTLTPESGIYSFNFDTDMHGTFVNYSGRKDVQDRVPLYNSSAFSGRDWHTLWIVNDYASSWLIIDYFEVTELIDEPASNSTPSAPASPQHPASTDHNISPTDSSGLSTNPLSQRMPIGPIVGALAGGIVVTLAVVLVIRWFCRSRSKRIPDKDLNTAIPFLITDSSDNSGDLEASSSRDRRDMHITIQPIHSVLSEKGFSTPSSMGSATSQTSIPQTSPLVNTSNNANPPSYSLVSSTDDP